MLFGKLKNKSDRPGTSVWERLQSGLGKTRSLLLTDVRELFSQSHGNLDNLLEELETRLIMADVGVESTLQIINALEQAARNKRISSAEDIVALLQEQMLAILRPVERPLEIPATRSGPFIFLVIGVNGAGKTTTIGKLANLYKNDHKVLLVAGDTFRAAAIEQLQVWGNRNNLPVVSDKQGADSSAVIFDGLAEAKATGADIIIADTAGRLQNKSNLVDELKKIRRTIARFDSGLPVETLLVVDASNGQNALVQAQQFHAEIGVSGIVLTKLDGSARGGIVFALASRLGIPLRFIGTGEGMEDICEFRAADFVHALLNQKS